MAMENLSIPKFTRPPVGRLLDRRSPLATGLALLYPLNEGGGTPRDLAGYHALQLQGTNNWAETNGQIGLRSSTSGTYAQTALDATSWTTGSLTAFFSPVTTGATRGILSWADAFNSGSPFILLQDNSGTLRYYVDGGYQDTSQTILAGKWYLATVTWQKVGSNYQFDFYLGSKHLSTHTSTGTTNLAQSNAQQIFIGSGFNSQLDGVTTLTAAWNRCLGAGDVAQLGVSPYAMVQSSRLYAIPTAPTGRFRRLTLNGGFKPLLGGGIVG